MFEYLLREPKRPHSPNRVGVWLAVGMFGLVSAEALWVEAVEHGAAFTGFFWLLTVSITGIQVARWLGRFSAHRLAVPSGKTAPPHDSWPASGSAVEIGTILLVPGASCWFAFRAAHASITSAWGRHGRAALWALWSLAGTAGQCAVAAVFVPSNQQPDTGLGPDIALDAAGLVNALAIALLIALEPGCSRLARRSG